MRLAAAIATGGLLLVPSVMATSAVTGIFPLAASGVGPGSPPNAGDLLAALRRSTLQPEDYGASGRLPEADTLSAELLAALAGPATGSDIGAQATVPPGPLGIPGVMLDAYIQAEQALAVSNPRCGITWSVLASIGRIESNHARGGAVDQRGTTLRPILGPQLAGGPGMAAIPDTDNGLLDGDTVWDRAVGPMQFIPGTWAGYATDGDDDGTASPHNIYDATEAAGKYLCSTGEDLREPGALARAIFRYNHSDTYVATVLTWAAAYAAGVTPLPSSPAPELPPVSQPTQPTTPTDPTTPPSSTTTTPTSTTTTPTCPTSTTPTSPTTSTSTSPTTTSPTPTTTLPPGCPTPTSSSSTTPPTTSSTTVDQTSSNQGTTTQDTTQSSTQSSGGTSSVAGTSTDATSSSTQPSTQSSTEAPVTTTPMPSA